LHGSAFRFSGSSTRSQVSFVRMEFISDSIVGRQLAAFVAWIAFSVCRGFTGVRKEQAGREPLRWLRQSFRSTGNEWASRFWCDRTSHVRTCYVRPCRTDSSTATRMIYRYGSFRRRFLLLGGSAGRDADLVCYAGLSKGAVTSENVTLRTSIGRSVGLCIADSLKTTSELRTT
jgi:hypothetical protein